MKNLEKSEFKKLTWKDNATDFGKERGLVYVVGEFSIESKPSYFIEYRITNNYDAILDVKKELRIFCSENTFKSFDFKDMEEAKQYCQKHFEQFITKTFFK